MWHEGTDCPALFQDRGSCLHSNSSISIGFPKWKLQASLYAEPALQVSRKIPPYCSRQTPQLPPLPQDLYSSGFGSKLPGFNRKWKKEAHDLTISWPKQMFLFCFFYFSFFNFASSSSFPLYPSCWLELHLALFFSPASLHTLFHSCSFLSILRTKPHSSTLPPQSKQQLKATTYKSVRSQRSQDQIEIKQSLLSQQQHCNSASPWNISVHLKSLLSTHSPGKVDAISFIIISRSEKIEFPHPM